MTSPATERSGEDRPAPPPARMLLEVRDLRTHFFTESGVVKAVDGVTFGIERGRTLGLVGESGSGKSVTALSILRLVSPPGRIVGGEVLLEGRDLLRLSESEMRGVRGNRISMVFQEPMSSLNPVFTVGAQIAEPLRVHQALSRRQARERAVELLERVGISDPRRRAASYPHQLSGGMRQRVMIAMALACRPSLLIADEPTTALDVTIQAQIMELLQELQREFQMSILIITHNLALVAEVADHIAVLYGSKVVEQAAARELFRSPLHPYTRGLLESIPRLGVSKRERLAVIPGAVPNPLHFPAGCKFHPRCRVREPICEKQEPALLEARAGHLASCHLIKDDQGPLPA
jgi:oligopeptide/dipeptide ABC transporter ATP-binding protein